MSKYQNLPDIDTSQPDVFQTEDVPDFTSRARDPTTGEDDHPSSTQQPLDSEAIDTAQLPERGIAGKAFQRQEKSLFTFRPRLPPITRARASSSSSSSSDGDVPRLRETRQAKMRRLKRELADLEAEISQGAEEEVQPSKPKRAPVEPKSQPPVLDLVAEMQKIREGLDRLEIKPVLLAEGSGAGAGVATLKEENRGPLDERIAALGEVVSSDEQMQSEPVGSRKGDVKLSELDERLAELEKIIGPVDAGVDDTTPHAAPLIPTLAKLDHLLTLLTQPRHLDAISRRLKLLLVDLDRAAALSRRTGSSLPSDSTPAPQSVTLSSTDHATLSTLFNLLPRLDPLLPLLPPLLSRLRSLATLHADASAFAATLKGIQADRTRIGERGKETSDVLKGLTTGLTEAESAVKANWETVGERLKGLEERVKALQT